MSHDGVELTEVVAGWPGGDWALRVSAWTVSKGGHAAVVGASGVGKSTLLGLLSGERAPGRGEVWVGGEPLHTADEARRRRWRLTHVGLVTQDHVMVSHLSVLDNVLLAYRIGPLVLDREVRDRAMGLLDAVGLRGMEDRRPTTLSQGERQRVAIARALVISPSVVLADEPTSGLDPRRTDQVVELLRRSCEDRGATLIVVTHDPTVRAGFEHVLELT